MNTSTNNNFNMSGKDILNEISVPLVFLVGNTTIHPQIIKVYQASAQGTKLL